MSFPAGCCFVLVEVLVSDRLVGSEDTKALRLKQGLRTVTCPLA